MKGIIFMNNKYEVLFFEDSNGKELISSFLEELSEKNRARVFREIDLLENNGPALKEPHTKYLKNGIFELRISIKESYVRIFYFYDKEKIIILTHGFMKKTKKTPVKEIKRALKYRQIYQNKKEN